MPNDARNKLRNMGGIMASSPELMQVAQGFQMGGPVMSSPVMPAYDSVTIPGVSYPVVGAGRVGPMPPQMPSAGVGSFALPNETPGRRRAAAMVSPLSPPASSYLFDEAEPTVDDLLRDAAPAPLVASPASGSGADRRDSRVSPQPSDAEPSPGSRGRGRLPTVSREAPELTRQEKAAEAQRLREEANKLTGRGSSNAKKRLEAEATALEAEAAGAGQEEYYQQGGPSGLAALATPLQTSVDDPEKVKKMQDALQKTIEEQTAPVEGPGVEDGTGGPAPAPTKRDLRSRYKEKIELFKEIYGESDEDRARDKAMSLAMLGLAIAAGQSPDALTNIAQGAMVGLQGMSEQEQARREREQGLRTLALETAIGEQSAAAEAEAEAARMDIEQENRLELEREKARLGAMYGAGSRDARNIIDFTQNAYDSAFTAASEQTAPDYDSETETPHQYAMRQAQQAAASMQKMFPGYGGQAVPTGETSGGEGVTVPTVTSQAEYDALPSGSQFMQNGQLRRKP